MLWFRAAAVASLFLTLLLSVSVFLSCLIMCVNPSSSRSMDVDPSFNGTLSYYIAVILVEAAAIGSSIFGFLVAFKVWKNNMQLDHKLRKLFTLWLSILGISSIATFFIGIFCVVRTRAPQEEIMTLYEIFAKYNQDVSFVGSFERFQRENSCCGVNGADDWYNAQIKTGSLSNLMGGMGMDPFNVGNPSTGKCHLTMPTTPLGCGKKLLEVIQWTLSIHGCLLLLQALASVAAMALAWQCFFYWIEKEVIIIPEDEVSNLIVIEPETSTSTVNSTSVSGSVPSSLSGSSYSGSGSQYTRYSSRPESRSRYSSIYQPSSREYLGSRFSYNGYSGTTRSFYPNSIRPSNMERMTQLSSYYGTVPTIGGPHSLYYNPSEQERSMSSYYSSYQQRNNPSQYYSYRRDGGSQNSGSRSVRYSDVQSFNGSQINPHHNGNHELHYGHYSRSVYHHGGNHGSIYPPHPHHYNSSRDESEYFPEAARMFSGRAGSQSRYSGSGIGLSNTDQHKKHHQPHVHKEHSFNHMLHKQEKALGGKVLAEMHIDHSRDPDPINSQMDTAKGRHGHRAHHATIAIIKNKKAPKPKTLQGHPEKGHGQTGHLAADILDMSGGAAAVKSMIDDINLPVEHGPQQKQGYVNKLHKAHKKKSQMDHPDYDHPGHGPVHNKMGKFSAPSVDGSQAQSLVDIMLTTAKPKRVKESEHVINPHSVQDNTKHKHGSRHAHEHHGHHHNHHSHDYERSAEVLYKNPHSVTST